MPLAKHRVSEAKHRALVAKHRVSMASVNTSAVANLYFFVIAAVVPAYDH